MPIESSEFEKSDSEKPIVDIEVNKATLETWEKKGLKHDISTLVDGDFERLVPLGGKFELSADMFACTNSFIQNAERSFGEFGVKNIEDKLREVKDDLRKVVLNFTFKELEIDPNNPEITKQERIKQDNQELFIRHFKTNQSRIDLASNGIDWWLERVVPNSEK